MQYTSLLISYAALNYTFAQQYRSTCVCRVDIQEGFYSGAYRIPGKTKNTQNYITFLRLLLTFHSQTSHTSPLIYGGAVDFVCSYIFTYLSNVSIRSASNLNEFLSALLIYSMGYDCSQYSQYMCHVKGLHNILFYCLH